MAAILRKMMKRASDPPSLSPALRPDWFSKRANTVDTPLGAFEGIPQDVLMQILKFLGPEGAMTMILVSKSWKPLVTDHDLWIFFLQNHHSWNSLLFSETHQRLGYPLQRSLVGVPQLSFMEIYCQRAQVPESVILDIGVDCKFGWSKNDYPSGGSHSYTDLEKVRFQTTTYLHDYFTTVYRRMRAYPESQPIVLSIPFQHSRTKADWQLVEEAILSALFEMKVPAVCVLNQITLALYAARLTSGIAVNIGVWETSIVPVINGETMDEFVEIYPFGSRSRIDGENGMYLDKAVANCMNRCLTAEKNDDSSWFKTIVFCEGTAFYPVLADKLERELHRHFSPSIANGIKVIPPPYGRDTSWVGAKLISNVSTFPRSWCVTKDQFQSKLSLKVDQTG